MIGITTAEFIERIDRLKRHIRRAGLEQFLVTSPESVYYLTGISYEPLERPFFLIVPSGDRAPTALVPKLEERHFRSTANGVGDVLTYPELPAPAGETWTDRLRPLLAASGLIGVEPHLRRDLSDALAEELPNATTVCLPLIEKMRLTKSAAELALIRRAAHYADLAVAELLGASYAGATVAEGFARTGMVTRRVIREVPDWQPLTTRILMATWAAPRSADPHCVPALDDRLGPGPHVALALTRINGYCAESERTYFTLPPNAEMRRVFAAMQEARRVVIELLRPGVPCGDVDAAVSEFLAGEGYEGLDRRLHRAGHGIGLAHHEGPALAVGSDDILEPNMVVSVEPGIYLEGLGGFRHSDTVRITETGYERLTHAPETLERLTLRGWRPIVRSRGRLVRKALDIAGREARPALPIAQVASTVDRQGCSAINSSIPGSENKGASHVEK